MLFGLHATSSLRRAPRIGFVLLAALAAAFPLAAEDKAAEAKPKIDPSHPLAKPLQLAYESREALEGLNDYEALFSKKEIVAGRLKDTTMQLKLREDPFSVYLLFKTANAGREVIFVQGKNDNQLLVHEAGIKAFAGLIKLDPKGKDAMADNKYPVTMIGMRNLLEKIITQWEKEVKFGETEVKYYPDAKLGDVPCTVIESQHPQQRDDFKFQKTRLYIEKKTKFPVRVEQYAFPAKRDAKPPLVEEYTYSQIKANPGLKDKDFDHTNSSYAFPK